MKTEDELEKKQEENGQNNPQPDKPYIAGQNMDGEEDNDELISAEELEKKKVQNEFNAMGNTADKQIYAQNITGPINFITNMNNARPVGPELPLDKRYDLRETADCIEFIESFKNTEYLPTALILCLLKAAALSDLSDLKARISDLLPHEIVYDAEGREVYARETKPYISLNSLLAVIGGKKFVTDEGIQCVTLDDNEMRALTNILEQFPALQDTVLDFIVQMAVNDRYYTIPYSYQVASAAAVLISSHIIDAENKLFPRMYTNSDNLFFLANMVYSLYSEIDNKDMAELFIRNWLLSDIAWMWKTLCYIYVQIQNDDSTFKYEKELQRRLLNKVKRLNPVDCGFIAWLLMYSKSFRTMMCIVFHDAFAAADNYDRKRSVAQTYINIVRRCYYKVNAHLVELPLAACDTKKQQELLTDILERIMVDFHLRRQLYTILEAYLKELSHYTYDEKVIKHIAAYICNMCYAGEEYREDIRSFLKKWQGKAAWQTAGLLE